MSPSSNDSKELYNTRDARAKIKVTLQEEINAP